MLYESTQLLLRAPYCCGALADAARRSAEWDYQRDVASQEGLSMRVNQEMVVIISACAIASAS